MTWRTGSYDTDAGNPQAIRRPQPVAELRQAGARRTADAVERAVALRDQYLQIRAELQSAPIRLRRARQVDAQRHAQQLTKSAKAPLSPAETEREQARTAQLETRQDALREAVSTAMDQVVAALARDRGKVDAKLDARRAETLDRLHGATQVVRALVADLQAASEAASWIAVWPSPRWKYSLVTGGSIPAGSHRLSIAEALQALDGLAAALATLELPGDAPQPAAATGFSLLPSG